jgi:hypothetical protein
MLSIEMHILEIIFGTSPNDWNVQAHSDTSFEIHATTVTIATNFCCDTTAREAHAREFKVLFLSDGTASRAGSSFRGDGRGHLPKA